MRFYSARKTGQQAINALFALMLGILLDTVYWGVSTFFRFFPSDSYAHKLLLSIRVDPVLWIFPKLCVLLGGVYAIYVMKKIR